jgi:hypothetical protein
MYQYRVLKKSCDRLGRGPGAETEPAGSIGWVAPRRAKLFSAGGGGGIFPAPSGEKSAPHDSKRIVRAPRPGRLLVFMPELNPQRLPALH